MGGRRCRCDPVQRVVGKSLRTRAIDVIGNSHHVTTVRGTGTEIISQVHHVSRMARIGGRVAIVLSKGGAFVGIILM